MMARYLVYTSPARGHLYPVVPTLEELLRRGHEVVVRTLSSEIELLRSLGFAAAPIDPAIERKEHADWRARTPIGALHASLDVFFERARYDGPDLQRAIEEERPDVLLIDINTWGAMAVAEGAGPPARPGGARNLQPPRPRARRRARRARRAAGREDRAFSDQGASYALHDGRTVRVPALGLAGERAHGRPRHLGSTGGGARVASEDGPPASSRHLLNRISERCKACRGGSGRSCGGRCRSLGDECRRRPLILHTTSQRPHRALRAAQTRPRASVLRGLSRRHGHHPEGARFRSPRVRRAVRTGPVRCRPARPGCRRRNPAARLPAAPGASPECGTRGDGEESRRTADSRGLRCSRRSESSGGGIGKGLK